MSLPSPNATYEVTDAKNPALNGTVTFQYPDVLTQILIGTRETELANVGRRLQVNPETLPRTARALLQAIATLEYVVKAAPEGWYSRYNGGGDYPQGGPVINPGAIGNGDERVVIAVWNAYLRFRNAVQDEVQTSGLSKPDNSGVVPSSEVDGQPTDGETDGSSD